MISRTDFKRKIKEVHHDLAHRYEFLVHISGDTSVFVYNKDQVDTKAFRRMTRREKLLNSDYAWRRVSPEGGVVIKDAWGLFKEHRSVACAANADTTHVDGLPFKNGDIITGIDRSYSRSIYRFDGVLDSLASLAFVAINGTLGKHTHTVDVQDLHKYRLATDLEIRDAISGNGSAKNPCKEIVMDTETSGLGRRFNDKFDMQSMGRSLRHPISSTFSLPIGAGKTGHGRVEVKIDGMEGHLSSPYKRRGKPATKECDCGAKVARSAHASWCKTQERS